MTCKEGKATSCLITGEATFHAFLTWLLNENDWETAHSKLPDIFLVGETLGKF